ncbi:hypothetical protein [Amycolatopsis sp. NPDC051128]|uniref:hypothetical protein n=1 Tax=Amycolatopsis sp. NPDC051128 TaxID=3155412 RepID=UPI00342EA765
MGGETDRTPPAGDVDRAASARRDCLPENTTRDGTADPAVSGLVEGRHKMRIAPDPRAILALQRAAGTRAVSRLLADQRPRPVVQRLESPRSPAPAAPAGPIGDRSPAGPAPAESAAVTTGPGPAGGPVTAGTPPAAPPSTGPPAPSVAPAESVESPPAVAPQAAPVPASAADAPTGPGPGGGTGLAELDDRAAARSQAIVATTAERKGQVRTAATTAAAAVAAAATVEQDRTTQALTAALEQVRISFGSARDGIQGQRRTSLDNVRDAARTRREAVDATTRDQKKALLDLGEDKAKAALAAGDTEAGRMTRESAGKAARALAIGEEKVGQYRGYDRASRIAAAAREMAGAAADRMTTQAGEVAAAVRKDAGDLAAKIRREAQDGAAKFDEAGAAARRTIDDAERKSVQDVDKAADDAIAGLRGQADQLTGQLRQALDAASGQLALAGPAATAGMSGQAAQGEAALDRQATQADAAITAFTADVAQRLSGVSPAAAAPVVAEADAHLAASLAEFDSAQAGQVGDTVGAFQAGGADGQARLAAGTGQLVGPLLQAAARFETTAADTATKTTGSISQAETTATGAMEKAAGDLDKSLKQQVTDSGTRWDGQIAEAGRQMRGKVDDALAAQQRELDGLGGKISEKAEEIEHESWWERALGFVGGIIVGLFEELWDLVKGLLIVLLVVLALAVVVLLIAVAIALIVGGFEGILLAIAFVLAVVEIAEAILAVLAVVGLILLVVVVAWRVYQAWVRDDLSDYERGKLIGRSITDILSVFLPGRVLARLRGWLRLRQLARLVGGEARLAALITWAGGDLAAVERLAAELRSVDEFEVLLTRTASLEEFLQLRRLCNNDLPLTIRMLGRARAAELIPAIADFGGDVVFLDRLLGELGTMAEARRMLGLAGGDVARLRRWVTFFEGARNAEAALGQAGRDAALLDELVARTANRAELARLLLRLNGNAPLLRDLLLLTDDVPQLDRMLGMLTNDGVELRRLLQLAGGRPAAAAVEQLMQLARAEGRAASNIEALLNEAGGNPAEVLRLLNIARRFAGRQVAPANIVPAPGYAGADLRHFLIGHTYSFFDFTTAGAQGKTFWPPSGAGGDLARVQADLQATCAALSTPGSTAQRIAGGVPTGPVLPTPVTVVPPAVAPGAGQIRGPVEIGAFQFGTRGAAPHTVGQFFPRPAPGFEHHTQRLLHAIREIMAIL